MSYSVNPLKTINVFETATRSVTGVAASADLNNFGYRGAHVTVSATGVTGNGTSLTVKVQGKDPVSGQYYDIHGAALPAVTANLAAPNYLSVYPGIAETGNQTVSDVLPKTWRIHTTLAGTGGAAVTYGVGVILVP